MRLWWRNATGKGCPTPPAASLPAPQPFCQKLHAMPGSCLAVLATGSWHSFAELPGFFLPCFPPVGDVQG